MDYEIVVIGAGVVGLAIAAKLSEKNNSILVLERHESFGRETSSRNSEVIHAGIYYPTGTLKAKLCVAGNPKIYDWCKSKHVPHKNIGKYIIAVTRDEEADLDTRLQQARANGVTGIDYVSMEKFHREEPNIRAVAALWSQSTGIVDSHSLMESYENHAVNNGVDFAYNHKVTSVSYIGSGYKIGVETSNGEKFNFTTEKIINSAGLDCDTIAAYAGIDIDKASYRLNYSRGHYFRIASSKHHLVNHLVYPVPLKNLAGLGIHVTVELNGELKLGPDVQFLKERKQEYIVPENLHEIFYKAASNYLIGLDFADIYADQSGIRPKLQTEGGVYRDFIIKEESDKGLCGLINLIGIESPGLTCSLEIAEFVSNILF